jgi:hypothetical protein
MTHLTIDQFRDVTFVLSTDDQSLFAFPNTNDAIAYCEGIDVEDGGYLFWDRDGASLSTHFVEPNSRGTFGVASGRYVLSPNPKGQSLLSILEGKTGPVVGDLFPTVDAVAEYLKSR